MKAAHGPPPGGKPTRLHREPAVSRRTCCLRPGVSGEAFLAASLRPVGPHIADRALEVMVAGVHLCCRRPHAVAPRCHHLHPDGCCHRRLVQTCRVKKRRNAWPTSPQSSEAVALPRLVGVASRSTGATGWHSPSTPAPRTPSVTRVSPVSGHTLLLEMPLLGLQRVVHDTKMSGTGETAHQLDVGTPRNTGTR